MSDYKIRLGRWGENLAANFLTSRGYRISGRNFYTAYGEIDLIAERGDEILFVEVKTRSGSDFGYPEEAVNYFKVRHLIKVINIFFDRKRLNKFWRLDAISVEVDKARLKAKISWFKNVGQDY